MFGLGIYLLLFLVSMAVFMFSRVRFAVAYMRHGKDDHIKVEMSLLKGLIRYKTEVPVIEMKNYFLKPMIKVETDIEGVVSHPVSDKGIIVRIPFSTLLRNLPQLINQGLAYMKQYHSVLGRLLKGIRCHELKWATEIGLGDPADTGIATGLLWAGKGMAYARFRSSIGEITASPSLSVRPCFDCLCLRLDFNCIFDMRIGHIIIAGLNFVKLLAARKFALRGKT